MDADKARVLIVDDEEPVCRALRRLLRSRYRVVVACSGPQALELLEQDGDFAAIVLDLIMPEVSGMAIFEWLKQHRPRLCDRVVVLTGGVFDREGRRFLEHWRGPLVEKPFDTGKLLQAVGNVVAAAESAS